MSGYSHNPINSPVNFIKHNLVPSAVGAAGALGIDVLLGLLPLPDMLKTPTVRPIVRIVGAVGLGMIGSQLLGRKVGEQIAAGALTVTLYDVLKGALLSFAPSITLSGMDQPYIGWMSPAMPVDGVGEYVSGVSEYVD